MTEWKKNKTACVPACLLFCCSKPQGLSQSSKGKHKVRHRCGKIVYTYYFFLVGMQTLLLLGMYLDITSLPGFPDHFPPTENREKSEISKMWPFWKIFSELPRPPTKMSFRNHKTMTQQIKTLRESYPNHIYGYMPPKLEFARF